MTGATLGGSSPAEVSDRLAAEGLWLDFGAATLHVRSGLAGLAAGLRRVYPDQPLNGPRNWADFSVAVRRPGGLRRWLRPQVEFHCDAGRPFDPFPASHALPLLEWGTNWLIGQHLHHLLLLHAGAVERDGFALLMPATPGSGKSTLTAALACRGWRLLSDEFGAWDTEAGAFVPVLKAVALKNASIDVIRRFAPDARLGPSFAGTRKGTVAHLAPPEMSTARRAETAEAGAFVLPRWEAGARTRVTPMTPTALFAALAFNAFNYRQLGSVGFEAVLGLSRRCMAWELVYGDLDAAIDAIEQRWPPRRVDA